jgi:lipopolysaccharide biosynthesis glycosyltransferase
VHNNLKCNIFIGLDEPNKIAFEKCKASIINQNTRYNISIHAINYNTIKEYERVKDRYESTQFAFARFFTPFLSEYNGVSIFCDGDFLFLDSIDNLIDLYDPKFAIQCCKHEYTPKDLQLKWVIKSKVSTQEKIGVV